MTDRSMGVVTQQVAGSWPPNSLSRSCRLCYIGDIGRGIVRLGFKGPDRTERAGIGGLWAGLAAAALSFRSCIASGSTIDGVHS